MSKNEKKKNKLITITIIILAMILLVLCLMLVFRGKRLDTNTSLVNELYTKLGQNDLSYCNGLDIYSNNAISYDELNNTSRICNVVANLYINEEADIVKIDKTKKNNTCSIKDDISFAIDNYEDDICTISRIDKKKVGELYNNFYGKNLENYDTFNLNNTTICYSDDEYYYCGLAESYTVTVGEEKLTYRAIKDAIKKNNKIYIYDYFIKIVNDECYTTYDNKTKNVNCTSEYQKENVNYDFLKKYGTLYRHIFEKNDNDEYYWIKTEQVKSN